MDTNNIGKTQWGVPKSLFDYSEVVTFQAGEGPQQQWFAFDIPRLCEESSYFNERLHGDYPEAKIRHFELKSVDPTVLACMLRWYRGWGCSFCCHDLDHAWQAFFLAEQFCIPRYEQHMAWKVKTLSVDYGDS